MLVTLVIAVVVLTIAIGLLAWEQRDLLAQGQRLREDVGCLAAGQMQLIDANDSVQCELARLGEVVGAAHDRITTFSMPKAEVVTVTQTEYLPRPLLAAPRTPTRPMTDGTVIHLVLMNRDETQVVYVDRVDARRRSPVVEYDGRTYRCASGETELGYFIYRQEAA